VQVLIYNNIIMQNILVTGGAGFIGNHLCEELLKLGHKVLVYDNLSLGTNRNIARFKKDVNFSFIKGELLNSDEFENIFVLNKFDMIFHLAANSDIASSSKSPQVDLLNTFNTTIAVLEKARIHNIKKIFFCSTGAIYGDTNLAVNENSGPLIPISHYGAAKLASEGYLSAYSHNYGIQVWIARFPNVVGEYATHGAIYDFIRKLKNNPTELEVLGNGQQIKPYIYVKELVNAILFIWNNSNDEFNVYNIGVDSRTRVSEIAEMVVSSMNLNSPIKYGESNRGWVGDVSEFKYDAAKLKALGWSPSLSSNEAVKKAIEEILIEQNTPELQ
jgi:UDP-glucose 4-epimerase